MNSFGEWARRVNWFGFVTGVFLLIFGLLAPVWWRVTFGGEAVVLEISPFNVNVTAFDIPMTSPLVTFVCIAARITIIVAGALTILGSVFTQQWWSKKLIKFGSLKILWMVIALVVVAIIAPIIVEKLAGQMAADANMQLSLPILSGSSTVTAQVESSTISAPITMELTGFFFLAIVTAALGITTRIYHRKLTKTRKN